jgi:hypothetical protein
MSLVLIYCTEIGVQIGANLWESDLRRALVSTYLLTVQAVHF